MILLLVVIGGLVAVAWIVCYWFGLAFARGESAGYTYRLREEHEEKDAAE